MNKKHLQECKHSTSVVASIRYPSHNAHIKYGLTVCRSMCRCIKLFYKVSKTLISLLIDSKIALTKSFISLPNDRVSLF